MHHGKLVVSVSPCTACQITADLNAEALVKVSDARQDFEYEVVAVSHPSEIANVEGMEVESLPAVVIDGEQISAGTVVSFRQILSMLDSAERIPA